MRKYIFHNIYDTGFGDLVPSLVCNAFAMDIVIITVNCFGGYHVQSVNENNSIGDNTVHLMKRDEHYDALLLNMPVPGCQCNLRLT